MGLLFCYGLLNYPDAPIHPCVASNFCGKQGQPHTENEYHQFSVWESLLAWSWPSGMLVLFLLNREKIRRRGASSPN
jgi:hypothetical protein